MLWLAMPFTPLQSSMLAGFDYDPTVQTLKIRFKDGHEAAYLGVPPDVAEGLDTAGSPGKFFHSMIKDRFTAW